MTPVLRMLALCLVCALCLLERANAIEVLRWERLPLSAQLVVGQERVILIDRAVRVAVPTPVRELLRVQSAGGALYLKAAAPFPTTRLQLQDTESGGLVLLELAAGLGLGVLLGWVGVQMLRRVALPASGLYPLAPWSGSSSRTG